MNVNAENEKPLENIVPDGGFCAIFERVGCVGDSLASGEFESTNADGTTGYNDMFRWSWIQYMARKCGFTGFNFTRGGMTAKEFNASFGASVGFEKPENLCQAYILALGVNDVYNARYEVGTKEDIDLESMERNKDTFAGEYGKIIQKIKRMQPKARIFLVTMPRDYRREGALGDDIKKQRVAMGDAHQKLLYDIAGMFEFTYVIDLRQYAPVYDEAFNSKYHLGGHLNPMGYKLTADYMASYIDYIIRHNFEDFKQTAFIGTPYHSDKAKW